MGGRDRRAGAEILPSWPLKPYVLANVDFSGPKRHAMLFMFVCLILLVLVIESSFTYTDKCSTIELYLTLLYLKSFEIGTLYVVQAGSELAPWFSQMLATILSYVPPYTIPGILGLCNLFLTSEEESLSNGCVDLRPV